MLWVKELESNSGTIVTCEVYLNSAGGESLLLSPRMHFAILGRNQCSES